jgi:DNA-binding MarR family transcriptional regulator
LDYQRWRSNIPLPDVVAVFNRLEAGRLAVRQRDAHDRRSNAITITPAGQRALAELEGLVEAAQQELLAPLSPAQRDQLVALLQQLVDHRHGTADDRPTLRGNKIP